MLTLQGEVNSRARAPRPLSSCTAGSGSPHLPHGFGGQWAETGQPGLGWLWQSSTLEDLNRVSPVWEEDVGSHPGSEITQERSRPPLRFKIPVPKLRGQGTSPPSPRGPRSWNWLWGDTQFTVFTGKRRAGVRAPEAGTAKKNGCELRPPLIICKRARPPSLSRPHASLQGLWLPAWVLHWRAWGPGPRASCVLPMPQPTSSCTRNAQPNLFVYQSVSLS